jgi:hypothetical protein
MLSYTAIDSIINVLKQNASALGALQNAATPIPQLESAISFLKNQQHQAACSLEAFLKTDYHRVTQALLGLNGLTYYNLSQQKQEFFALLRQHLMYHQTTLVSNQFVQVETKEGSSYLTITLEPKDDSRNPHDNNSIQIPSPTIDVRISSRSVYDVNLYTPVVHPFTGDHINLNICTVSDSEIDFMLSQLQSSVGMISYEPLEFYITSIANLLYEYEQLLYKNRAFQIHGKESRGKTKISQLDMTNREIAVSHEVDSISSFIANQGDVFITVDNAESYGVLDSGYAWELLLDGSLVLNHQFNKYIDYRYCRSEEDKKYGRVSNPFGSRNNNTDLRPFYNPIRFLEQMFNDDTPTSIRVLLNDNGVVHPWARNLDMTTFEPLQEYKPEDVVKLNLMRLELIKRVSVQYLKNKSMGVFNDV